MNVENILNNIRVANEAGNSTSYGIEIGIDNDTPVFYAVKNGEILDSFDLIEGAITCMLVHSSNSSVSYPWPVNAKKITLDI